VGLGTVGGPGGDGAWLVWFVSLGFCGRGKLGRGVGGGGERGQEMGPVGGLFVFGSRGCLLCCCVLS